MIKSLTYILNKKDNTEYLFRALSSGRINGHSEAWVVQLVKCPTLAQVIISRSVFSSAELGSVLTAHSLEPDSDTVSPSLSAPLLLMICLCLSQK